jgi:transposase-like protein
MEAAIVRDEPEPESEARNEMQKLRPEHIRVISLRLRGKRWSEIAAELGVTSPTVWRWRQDYPEIDEIIRQESQDCLDASKHALASLVPKAVEVMREEMERPSELGGIRVSTAKYVVDKFSRAGELSDRGGPIGKAARLPDDALDAALDGAGGPTEPEPR